MLLNFLIKRMKRPVWIRGATEMQGEIFRIRTPDNIISFLIVFNYINNGYL